MKQQLTFGLSVLLLLAAGARLTVLIQDELGRLERNRGLAASIPKVGSLQGVGPEGIVGSAAPEFRYRLMFVVHFSSLEGDLRYWNAARKVVGPRASDIDWWGICDSGKACDASTAAAQFSIVSFMDPYQMRLLANADITAQALLYESATLRGMVARAATPAEMAEAIVRALPQQ